MKARDRFFLLIACLGAGIGACSWRMFSEALPFLHSVPCLLPFLIFPFLFALPQISWGYRLPFFLLRPFAIVGGLTFILLFYSMFLLVPYGLLVLATHISGDTFQEVAKETVYTAIVIFISIIGAWIYKKSFSHSIQIPVTTKKALRWIRILNILNAKLMRISKNIIDGNPRFLQHPFVIISGVICVLFFCTLIFFAFHSLLFFTISHSPAIIAETYQVYPFFSLVILAILLSIGIWQALFPRVVHISLTTQKPLHEDIHLAFLSDIHLGQVLGTWFSRRLVCKVNRLGADIILIGGDIIDGNLNYVLADGSLTPFQDLKAKYGTLAAFGNHDGYSFQLKRERQTLETLGIKVLEGEFHKLDMGVEVLGMRDYMFFPQDKLPPATKDVFSIVIDHEPRRMQEAAQKGYDLYLAGHTHAGQFFPFNYATRRFFPLSYGAKQFDKLLAYVTAGFGAWGAPFRLGQRAEIVLIHVHSEGKGHWAVPRCY